jgi:hypothetical protein
MAAYNQIIDAALHSGRVVAIAGQASLIVFRNDEHIAQWISFAASNTDSVRIVTVPLGFIASIVGISQSIDATYLIGVAIGQSADLSDTILKSYRLLRLNSEEHPTHDMNTR